ncbi:MAG: hypothetical protein OHK0046_02720 [Anaerolineae bacterium]
MSSFDFDPINFGAGVAAGWATAYVANRARQMLQNQQNDLPSLNASGKGLAARRADSRYLRDLLRYSQTAHLTGKAVHLSQVVIEPRFIPAPELAHLPSEDDAPTVFHIVPNIPDHPYLLAPYHVETLGIKDLDKGHRAVALLGVPGSGRTTALHAIALWSLGEVDFTPPKDEVQLRLDEEEQMLNNEQRAARIQDWIQAQAMLQNPDEDDANPEHLPFRQLTPVYVHLGNVILTRSELGRRVDPAEALLRAVQHYTRYRTAKTFPRNLYQRLNEGRVLLLIDGFDEVPAEEQADVLAWLKAFMSAYSSNFVIVTGPAQGYGGLMEAGFAPVFIRPWHDLMISQFVDQWAAAWPNISGGRRGAALSDSQRTAAFSDNRQRSAFELTLKTWAVASGADERSAKSWFDALITSALPNESLDALLPLMIDAATLQLNTGWITAVQLEQIANGQQVTTVPVVDDDPAPAADALHDEDVDALFNTLDQLDAPENDDAAETDETPQSRKEDKAGKAFNRFINTLADAGLLVRYRGGRWRYRHPLIAAYLGSLALAKLSPAQVIQQGARAGWEDAMRYAALHMPLDAVVQARLEAPPDMLYNHLLEMTRWLPYAGKVEWRGTLLTALGNMFVARNQYPAVRERIAAGLISTRDPAVNKIFQKAIQHPNADVRRLSCLGLGALQSEDIITRLISLMYDPVEDVTLAAGIALGAIATRDAIEAMAEALLGATKDSDKLGRIIAESFALIPAEYVSLYEAAQQDNIFLRRASVFGIRRINAPWAVITLYRVALEDEQFYVKTAAEAAFQRMEYGDRSDGVRAYPALDDIPWLRDWMLDQLESGTAPEDGAPENFLVSALQHAPPQLQAVSLMNIGQLGLARHTGLIYDMLRHRSGLVREAAQRALADLQLKWGQPLPSPV